jgi:cytochrome c-type biogenesis protein CcmH
MMGWLPLLLLLALSLGGLWVLGVRGGLLKATAAALLVGASGYALQGQPDLPGSPGQGRNERNVVPLTQARHAFFGNFSPEESWMLMSEALARDGKTEDAVGILRNAVGRYPTDEQLWIGLGNALVDHAHGLTPAAEFAYQRAAEVAPGRPAAPFFYGLALARSGDRAAAVELWSRTLANAPANAGWRPLIEQGVAALSGRSASGSGAPEPGQSPQGVSPR